MRSIRHGRAAVSLLCTLAAGALAACGSGGGSDDGPDATPTPTASPAPQPTGTPTAALPGLRLTAVARGLDDPLYVTAPAGDSSRLFVVEQDGRIRIVDESGVRMTPFLDITGLVVAGGEQGLLGLAFAPDYAQSGRFFVNYTAVSGDGDTVIAEYRRDDGDPDRAEPDAVRVLMVVDQPFPNHNGGMLAFGPDGLLYVALGDGGSFADPLNNGQRLDTKLGKILRLDVDRYPTPPAGNLPGGDPDIWDYGLRNPWRFSFDRATGDLYIGDVGQNEREEINVEPAGSGGRNYGWRVTEGTRCFPPSTPTCDTTGITFPVHEYDHGSDACSVIGGYVYRGAAVPELTGRYFYADFCADRIWSFVLSGGRATGHLDHTADLDPGRSIGAITSFGEDAAGELLVVDQEAGTLYRIERE